MIQLQESELSVFRPAWTQANLQASDDLYYCGIKRGYFRRSQGMPGPLLEKMIERR